MLIMKKKEGEREDGWTDDDAINWGRRNLNFSRDLQIYFKFVWGSTIFYRKKKFIAYNKFKFNWTPKLTLIIKCLKLREISLKKLFSPPLVVLWSTHQKKAIHLIMREICVVKYTHAHSWVRLIVVKRVIFKFKVKCREFFVSVVKWIIDS